MINCHLDYSKHHSRLIVWRLFGSEIHKFTTKTKPLGSFNVWKTQPHAVTSRGHKMVALLRYSGYANMATVSCFKISGE